MVKERYRREACERSSAHFLEDAVLMRDYCLCTGVATMRHLHVRVTGQVLRPGTASLSHSPGSGEYVRSRSHSRAPDRLFAPPQYSVICSAVAGVVCPSARYDEFCSKEHEQVFIEKQQKGMYVFVSIYIYIIVRK